MNWPTTFTVNAHIGGAKAASSEVISEKVLSWALGKKIPEQLAPTLAPPPLDNLKDWSGEKVGWGLILPYRQGLTDEQLAAADDAPEPIRALRAARGNAPVFRYRSDSALKFTHLITYRSGVEEKVSINSAGFGTKAGKLPFYLLIYGGPIEVPWELQFLLNANRAVGRLDIEGEGLENYVNALMSGWQGASSNVRQAVVWASNNGLADITRLMRDSVANKAHRAFANDSDMENVSFIDGFNGRATNSALIEKLSQLKPGFILTTSHGQTGPLDDLNRMGLDLGLPVDQDFSVLRPEELLSAWEPEGAIWYCHACCSAGCNATTMYDGLTPAGSGVDRLLKAIARLGAKVSPLPKLLLGAKRPLRAFIGHVEPTFDWTLRQPGDTDNYLTDPILESLYNRLFQPEPAGMALRQCYDRLGSLYTSYDHAFQRFNAGEKTRNILLFCQLAARDVQSMVILGDPTATLPPLK